jgi:hypothetical protein
MADGVVGETVRRKMPSAETYRDGEVGPRVKVYNEPDRTKLERQLCTVLTPHLKQFQHRPHVRDTNRLAVTRKPMSNIVAQVLRCKLDASRPARVVLGTCRADMSERD